MSNPSLDNNASPYPSLVSANYDGSSTISVGNHNSTQEAVIVWHLNFVMFASIERKSLAITELL